MSKAYILFFYSFYHYVKLSNSSKNSPRKRGFRANKSNKHLINFVFSSIELGEKRRNWRTY